MAHRELRYPHLLRHQGLHGLLHGRGSPTDDALLGAVEVGHHHVAVHRLQNLLNAIHGPEHGRHETVVFEGKARHGVPSCRHRRQSIPERDSTRGDQSAVLTQAVAYDQVGLDAVGGVQAAQRDIHRQDRRLRDGRLLEGLLCLGPRGSVIGVDEDLPGERAIQERGHDPVGFAEGVCHDGLDVPESLEHVHVLGALPRKQEGDLAGGAPPQIDALVAQSPPPSFLARPQGLEGLLGQGREFRSVSVVDDETHRGPQLRFPRRAGHGCVACVGAGLHGTQLVRDLFFRRPTNDQSTPQRRLGRCRVGSTAAILHGRQFGALDLGVADAVPPGNVLLQHQVEVRATEAEGAHAGSTDAAPVGPRLLPGPKLRVHREGRGGEVDIRVGRMEAHARWKFLVVERQRGLEHSCGARGALQVSDVGLHRTQGDGSYRQAEAFEHVGHGLDFHDVAHLGGRSVALHHVTGRRCDAGPLPTPLNGQSLAHRVRGGDSLPLAVAGPTHAQKDRIDLVAVPLGILQTLHEEDRSPLTHDEAVGSLRIGPAAGGRQRPDLAELHEGGSAHVGVDTTSDDGIVVVPPEAIHRGTHGRQGRGTRCIGDVVGPLQVEERRHPTRHDVAQFSRHGVFGDVGNARAHASHQLLQHGSANVGGQRLEAGSVLQFLVDLREEDPGRGAQMEVTAQGVAHDDRRPVLVQGTLGIAEVQQRFTGTGHGPFLRRIHDLGDLGRNGHAPAEGVPVVVPAPATDLGVRHVRSGRIGIVVQIGIPTVGDVGDAVTALAQILPEHGGVGRIR